jgi:hypothetical protein
VAIYQKVHHSYCRCSDLQHQMLIMQQRQKSAPAHQKPMLEEQGKDWSWPRCREHEALHTTQAERMFMLSSTSCSPVSFKTDLILSSSEIKQSCLIRLLSFLVCSEFQDFVTPSNHKFTTTLSIPSSFVLLICAAEPLDFPCAVD